MAILLGAILGFWFGYTFTQPIDKPKTVKFQIKTGILFAVFFAFITYVGIIYPPIV